MPKEAYNTKKTRKQFKGMARIMTAIIRQRGKVVEGPIRISLTDDEGDEIMTLTLEKK